MCTKLNYVLRRRSKGWVLTRQRLALPPQTLGGSFSAVSKPPIARVGAFFSIFRDLQDSHAFAPRQNQNLSICSNFRTISMIFQNFSKCWWNFGGFSTNFHRILPEFLQISRNFKPIPNVHEFWGGAGKNPVRNPGRNPGRTRLPAP